MVTSFQAGQRAKEQGWPLVEYASSREYRGYPERADARLRWARERRDRLLLVCALALWLLTLLGAAGERLGMERYFKANTVKSRTYSLFRQGCFYYQALPMMPEAQLRPLMELFGQLVREQPVFREAFGVI